MNTADIRSRRAAIEARLWSLHREITEVTRDEAALQAECQHERGEVERGLPDKFYICPDCGLSQLHRPRNWKGGE